MQHETPKDSTAAAVKANDEALATHGGVAPAEVPPWPARPVEWLTRGLAVRWLDYGVFVVERALAVAALLLMSLMMALDILHLSLVSEDSRLAAFMMRFAGELSASQQASFVRWTLAGEVVAFVVLCYAAVAWRTQDRPRWMRAAYTGAVLLGCYVLTWLVEHKPSRYTYDAILGGAIALATWQAVMSKSEAARQGRRRVMFALLAASPILFWLFHQLPDDFSFAQNRSLFLLLWVGFLGASMATYQRAHLRIDFVQKLIKGERTSNLYQAASLTVALAFTLVLLWVAYDYVFNPETGMTTTRSESGAIPDWVKVLAIPLTLGVMSLRLLRQTVEHILAAVRGPTMPAVR